jgi:hypothetical protein
MNGRIKKFNQTPKLGFPKIGAIRCGMKIERNGKTFPTSVDYFIPTGNYAKYFTDVYGDKPKVIQVMFLDDRPELVCDERLELRNNEGRLVAYGDGITFMVFDDSKEKYEPYSVEQFPDLPERLTAKHKSKWDTVLRLRVLVPAISGVIGYWEIMTKAVASSIPEITQIFDRVLEQKGFIKGILFDLHVNIHVSNKPNSRDRYPVLSLVPNHSSENKKLIEKHFELDAEPNISSKRIENR